ncbi:MAG: cobalamin biosynthesis protein [Gemmobacter sp.]
MRVAGFGFRTGAATASLRAALEAALNGGPPPDALATATDKVRGLAPLARALDLPLHAIAPEVIACETRATPNPRVPARYGRRSLSEAACLAAAGPAARLIVPATAGPDGQATCAIAEGADP